MPDSSPPLSPDAEIFQVRGWRRWMLMPLGWLARAWGASLRFEASEESLRALTYTSEPVTIVLWHNRLFLAAEIVRRYRGPRPAYALVSASKDGAWLEGFFSMVGMRCVRGSSSRLGREAAKLLVDVLRAGNDIGVTPDGPRGPMYDFKGGALIVARRARTPMLLLGGVFDSAWQLKSWDRFYVPKPFSRVRIHGVLLSQEDLRGDEESPEVLRARLLELNPDLSPAAGRECSPRGIPTVL